MEENKKVESLMFFIKISMILSFVSIIFAFLNIYKFNDASYPMIEFISSSTKDGIRFLANHKIQLMLILLILIVTIAFRNTSNINIVGLIVDTIMSIVLIIVAFIAQPSIINNLETNEIIKAEINYSTLYMFIVLLILRVICNIIASVKIILLIKQGEIDNPFKDGNIIETAIEETQDAMLGEGDNYTNDIPAQIETDSGRRRINKVQTRRNIYKKIFTNQNFLYPLVLIIIAIIGTIILLSL